jgi:hypothetical protein
MSISELRRAVERGCREAWRVARLGVIVKGQDYIHSSRQVWMSDWVRGALPVEPYNHVTLERPHKMLDPKRGCQLSVCSNAAEIWVFRKDGPIHRSRRPAALPCTL